MAKKNLASKKSKQSKASKPSLKKQKLARSAAAKSSNRRPATSGGQTRRDFIVVAASATAGVGAVAAAWPFVGSLNPAADVLALSSTEVDISAIEPGQAITVLWRGKPVFVRRRTKAEVDAANAVKVSDLPDPETDLARTKPGHEEWLIVVGVCTHLGCVPIGFKGDFGGWFCPCHGSHYDTSGRIRKGPAPANLAVPPYEFLNDTTIRIG